MDAANSTTAPSTVPTNAQNSPLFTCMACQVAFYSADQQRTHYRSDWHRYNLKRKVADMPPVTAESFAQRVLAQQAKTAEAAKKAQFSADCTVCKKNYSSENAFNNHLSSKKHKEMEAKMLQKMQMEEDLKAEQAAIEESIAESLAAATISSANNTGDNSAVATTQATGAAASADVAEAKIGAAGAERSLKVSDFPMSDEEDDDEDEDEDDESDAEAGSENTRDASKEAADTSAPVDADRERRQHEKEIKQQLHSATSEEEVLRIMEKKKATAPRLNIDQDCLFCRHKSDSFDANMSHMTLAHSLFIPDLEYIVDLRGLIKYLADKLSVANVCLYCNGRGRVLQSLDAVRKHMLDKGHTKIAYETEIDVLEISDFYDFSSTYPDAEEHDTDEQLQVTMVGHSARHVADTLHEEDGELVLPNGNRIGHRSLQRYYKQNIPAERPEKESVVIHKMLTSYQENPHLSNQLMHNRQTRALILSMPKGRQIYKDFATFKEKRQRQDFTNRMGMRMNNLQTHYREANPI
ncbi:pre-60S factor rei1 [Coemansia sp. Benny D115]|nr:pre-60S factor rei1 [Coemansia sp. Benny D115]